MSDGPICGPRWAGTAQELGGKLYDSLHEKLLPLPDATQVYPAQWRGVVVREAVVVGYGFDAGPAAALQLCAATDVEGGVYSAGDGGSAGCAGVLYV